MNDEVLKEVEVYTKFLYPGMILTGDGFDENGNKVIDKNVPLSEDKIRELVGRGIKRIRYTPEKPRRFKKEVSRQIISDESLNKAISVIQYLENSIKVEGERAKIPAKEINSVIQSFMDDIRSNSDAYLNLLQLFSEDDYNFAHSINVATISILLGISLKLEDDKVTQLGIAALLHDIGKVKIPASILNKPEKLTGEEWEVIKKHPLNSYLMIKDNPEFPKDVSSAILTHHESYLGGGYPLGFNHEKIPFYAQIITIADVFDAATSPRPYKSPMMFDEVFNFIMENSGKKFNPKFAQVFLRDMAKKINEEPIYPVGSFVLLNTGEIAEVVGHRVSEFTLRPIVEIFLKINSSGIPPTIHKIPLQIDLEGDYTRSIVRRIMNETQIANFRKIRGK